MFTLNYVGFTADCVVVWCVLHHPLCLLCIALVAFCTMLPLCCFNVKYDWEWLFRSLVACSFETSEYFCSLCSFFFIFLLILTSVILCSAKSSYLFLFLSHKCEYLIICLLFYLFMYLFMCLCCTVRVWRRQRNI